MKKLLIIPALLIAVLCMASTCTQKPHPPADVDYQIYLTNKSASKIDCKYIMLNDIERSVTASSMQRELITTIGFNADDPTKETSVNFKLSNASAGQFIDTTLTFKHIVLQSIVMKVEMTLNEDLSLTVVEKPL